MSIDDFVKEYVKELFDYSPENGILLYLERKSYHFNDNEACRPEIACEIFNKQHAGKRCSYIRNTNTRKTPYRYLAIKNKPFAEHRIIWLYMTGEWPETIDHINGNGLDNRWCNLRNVSMAENNKNRPMHKNNTTGEMNIFWMKSKRKYKVEINNPETGKLTYFGLFKTIEEAIPVRDKARKEFGYHANHGRD